MAAGTRSHSRLEQTSRGRRHGDSDRYLPAILYGCVPVFVKEAEVGPLDDVIDWSAISLGLRPRDVPAIHQVRTASCCLRARGKRFERRERESRESGALRTQRFRLARCPLPHSLLPPIAGAQQREPRTSRRDAARDGGRVGAPLVDTGPWEALLGRKRRARRVCIAGGGAAHTAQAGRVSGVWRRRVLPSRLQTPDTSGT
eukprot:1274755-Prymnesium_polylepis.1